MLERVYLVFSISTSAEAEGITFQYYTPCSDAGAERLRARLRVFRERRDFQLMETGEDGHF
jgi:hypothetical protein